MTHTAILSCCDPKGQESVPENSSELSRTAGRRRLHGPGNVGGLGMSSLCRMLLFWAVKSQKQANNCVIVYLGVLRQQVPRGCLDALGE